MTRRAPARALGAGLSHPAFDFADGHSVSDDLFCEFDHAMVVAKRKQRARMADGEFAFADHSSNLRRQREKPHGVGDGRAILPDYVRDFLLRKRKLGNELLVSLAFFYWIEVGALQVLDECEREKRFLVDVGFVADDRGNLAPAEALHSAKRRSAMAIRKNSCPVASARTVTGCSRPLARMLASRSRSSVAPNSFRGCCGFGRICASGMDRSALRGASSRPGRGSPAAGLPARSASSPRPNRRGFSVDIISFWIIS